MGLRYRVIAIGALGRNRLWGETEVKRFSHATTTLIQDEGKTILVDPSLPGEALAQRLDERTGLTPDAIDAVFLTTFRPVHRRSLVMFDRADWLMHEPEIEAMRAHLAEIAARADEDESDAETADLVRQERSILARVKAADEKLTPQVHLFPLGGASPGSAGLLLALATRTVVVAGDCVLTQDHFEAGRVFELAADVEQARESLAEVLQIADEVVPGHDNAFRVASR